MRIRVSPQLNLLLQQTAAHCGLDESDIFRATCRWARSHLAICSTIQSAPMYYEKRTIVKSVRDCDFVYNLTPESFCKVLAHRCTVALASKPITPPDNSGDYKIVKWE